MYGEAGIGYWSRRLHRASPGEVPGLCGHKCASYVGHQQALKRLKREIKRHARVVGSFPDRVVLAFGHGVGGRAAGRMGEQQTLLRYGGAEGASLAEKGEKVASMKR